MSSQDARSSSSVMQPPHDASEETAQRFNPALFELTHVHGRITLDNVYRNGLHALKQVEIRNLADVRTLVKMRSNLRNQIAFQLRNENIADLADADLGDIATNTVAWCRAAVSDDYHFNQLFNYVNHIDQLILEPQEQRTFILAFLSEGQHIEQDRDETTDKHAQDNGYAHNSDEEESYASFNITGSLFFFGYRLKSEADTLFTAPGLDEKSHQDMLVTSTLADYQLSVKFRATVCQSVLWTDVAETGINFDDCVLGEIYYKEFTIQNKSEIDLYWLLNTVDLSNLNREDWLQFMDAETGDLFENKPVPAYACRRIRLVFMPKEVGEFNYDLQVENANDSRNVVQTRIHATVRSALHKESIVISSGNVLDFGDCISGQWTVQQIVLMNVSEAPIDIRFLPEGAEVIFDIKSTLDDTEETQKKGGSHLDSRTNSVSSRKYSSNKHTTATPTSTMTSLSEVSGPKSEVSSRASSPVPFSNVSRYSEYDGSYPASIADPSGSETKTNTPSLAGNDDSDTDTGFRRMGIERIMLSEHTSAGVVATPPAIAESYTRIEDLVLKPGKERIVQVSYRPQKDASINDFNAGQLIRRNFRIVLEYGAYRSAEPKERKAIQCRARTCTSFVEVIPKEVNFGDTDVGTLKSLPINIFNRSDILARVELQFTSKVLNCLRGEITIQPRSYVELKLDLYPRKVNPEYRKQITLVNFLNHDNDQIIEVQSTNIDKNRVTFHSLFYRILTATGANYLDFGSIALNSPSLRTFTVENIRREPLTLEILTSMPDDIVIYTKKKRAHEKTDTLSDTSSCDSNSNNAICTTTSPDLDRPVKSKERHVKLRESISQRRSVKPISLNADNPGKPLLADAKRDFHSLRRLRIPHLPRMERAHSTTAYLDLATRLTNQVSPSSRRRSSQLTKEKSSPSTEVPHARLKSHTKGRLTKESHGSPSAYASAASSPELKNNSHHHHAKEPISSTAMNTYGSAVAKKNATSRSMGITAARWKSRKHLDWSDIAGKSRVPFEDLLSVLEHGSRAAPPLFPKQSAEEQFVRYQLAWRQELDRLIEKGDLVPTSVIHVDPQGEEEVIVVFTPNGMSKPHVQSAPKKQDARILLRLVDFDRNIDQTEFENLLDLDQSEIPVREVIVRAQLCRSIMDLGQKNINFGLVERNEQHSKSIVLHNRSETPLLYAIRKSGSIASGDIDLGVGRYGVVRSFGKREIEFSFEPTLPGPFMERLVVENIRDRTNDQVLSLKAMVRKPSTFFIKSLSLSFGPCLLDQTCQRFETIYITNTNKQSRLFEVRVDPNEVIFGPYYGEFDFVVQDESSNTLSKEAEEEIENLEQKLKIARRKGQPDKVKKYLKKLAKLRNAEFNEDDVNADGSVLESVTKQEEEKTEAKKITASEGDDATVGKESAIIFKKTSESIVFPLDPHASKIINVSFKAVMRPLRPDVPVDQEDDVAILPIKGRILAHEYKNTDVCKSIVYTATICRDQASYIEALASDETKNEAGNALLTTVTEPSAPNVPLTDVSNDVDSSSVINDPAQDTVESLHLERSFFDGGKVEVGQKTNYYVRVSNLGTEDLNYEFVADDKEQAFFIFPDTTTPLAPKETRKIMFEIMPTVVGKQQHTMSLKNPRTGYSQSFTLQILVHRKQYLVFPSLCEESRGELDLGFSYVDPGSKYSQVTPLLVENVSDQDLFIKCQSNLSHQVLIFMDESGDRGVVDMMPFKRGSMTTVWVAVQPSLLTGYIGTSANECRELVGGIKFSIYTQDDTPVEGDGKPEMLLMLTQTVKFTSIIGESHLKVSHQVINLGYTDLLHEEFYGAFTIQNKSGQLPLDYEVECSSGNLVLDRRGGTLHGWQEPKNTNAGLEYIDPSPSALQPSQPQRRPSYADHHLIPSVAQITFRIYAYRYGLVNEKLIVTNKHNSQEVFEIEVRLFVDCKRLDAWTLPSKTLLRSTLSDGQLDHADHREAQLLPTVRWESVYICPVPHGTPDAHNPTTPLLQVMALPDDEEARFYVREIEVANTSGHPMYLVVLSDLDITAGWLANEDKIRAVYAVDQGTFLQRSGQLILQPGQRVRVRLHCPSAAKLGGEERALALQGRSGSLKGMLVIYDLLQQLEVLTLELEALFCVSLAELSVDRIDLGKIGHITSWKPAKFMFTVRNLADVPVTYDIQGPSAFSFVPLNKNGDPMLDRRYYIPSRKSQTIEGHLDPRKLQDESSGLRRFDIQIANQRNGSNTMHLRLKALMTVFELCFDRLTHGDLLLPTLYHPISMQNVPCDNWFVVQNTTDDDIRFEIGADMTPELEDYVKLEVLSRYTNSPLKGGIAISPQGKMEIRVRASSNEMSRLPRDRPELTDPAGITVAKLWITTRPTGDEEEEYDRKIYEVIPVRCVIEETSTFCLSDRRLDFKLVTYYREAENGKESTGGESDDQKSVCMPDSCPLTVINYATKVPLRFKVSIDGPAEFSAQKFVKIEPLAEDGIGLIEPGGTMTLNIGIVNPKDSIPGHFKIHVDDLDALSETRQTVSIYVTEIVWDL